MPTYETGHLRSPDKDHLIALSARKHGRRLQALAAPLPKSYSARAQGFVGPVKDQASCGSCWDFSGTGMIEIAYAVAGIKGIVLSEEYTLSCCRNGGCGGDDNVTVLKWAKNTGLPASADYGSYTARRASCAFKPSMTLYKIKDWGFADGSGGNGVAPTDAIKQCIMQYGCVGSAIAADNAFMNVKPGQVFKGRSSSINHDIILTGWDDDKGAWELRNSWGAQWCDGGYCLIAYGANDVGTEAVWCDTDSQSIDWFV